MKKDVALVLSSGGARGLAHIGAIEELEAHGYHIRSIAGCSMMIRQNSILMSRLMNPDMLVDIQMTRYGSFDYHKSEKIIAIGRLKTSLAISKYENLM